MKTKLHNVRRHFSTVLISVSISLLMGGAGAYAAGYTGLISGQQIKRGTVAESKLDFPTRHKLDLIETAMRGDIPWQQITQEQTHLAIEQLRHEVEVEYIHK